MGALCTKPLTKSDLDSALESAFEPIMEALLVPDGNNFARTVTVCIRENKNAVGHGAILKSKTGGYLLLSAAHVLVNLTAATLNLSFEKGQEKKDLTFSRGALYVNLEYVKNGTHDVALLELLDVGDWIPKANTIPLILRAPEVGRSVVAHGQVLLRGTVTSSMNGVSTVLAHSVPSSSGCPVFDNKKNLVGIVHGSSKHRGRHAYADRRDDASVVYCHTLKFEKMYRVQKDTQFSNWLNWAEDVPIEVADPMSPMNLFEYTQRNPDGDLAKLMQALSIPNNEDLNLDEMMEKLAQHIKNKAEKVVFAIADLELLVQHATE